MRKTLRIILVAVLSVVIAGCGEAAYGRKVEGKWKLETPGDSQLTVTLEVAKDGKWSEVYVSPWAKFSASGTWIQESDALVRRTETDTTSKTNIGSTERCPILILNESVLSLKRQTKDGKGEVMTYRRIPQQ